MRPLGFDPAPRRGLIVFKGLGGSMVRRDSKGEVIDVDWKAAERTEAAEEAQQHPIRTWLATRKEPRMPQQSAILLGEGTRFGGETTAGLMRNNCAFTPRDMLADWDDAFAYAIITGDTGEATERHDWDADMLAFVKAAHERFKALADKKEDAS